MPKIPKWGLYGVIGVGGAGIIYAVWKFNKDQKAAAAATAAAAASQQNQYGYGSAISAQQYGYGSGGYGYGSYTYDPYGQNYGYGSYNSGLPEPPSAGAVTTNAQWVQAAVSALTAEGYTGQSVLVPLGKYVTGQALSAADESVVTAAIGAEGYPPVPGPTGYPPAMNPGGGGGGTGNTGGGNVTVPNVVGMTVGAAHNAMVAAGLKPGTEHINTTYIVTAQVPAAGTSVASGTTFSLTAKKG